MGRMKGEEPIVEGDVGIGERKRLNGDKDAYLAKRAKEAADCRNLGYKVEGEWAGDGTREEEVELNNKLERLREMLIHDPEKLRCKDVEDVIRYLDVGDIISSALKSSRVKEKEDLDNCWYVARVETCFVPSAEKVGRLVEIMLLSGIEELKAVDLYILYNNFAKAGFASMLLHALDSYKQRHLDGYESLYPKEMRAKIYKLCCVLPWMLFAHVMFKLTSLSVFKYSTSTASTNEDEKEEEIHKKAAESCDICLGKGKHSGVYGYYCSFWHYVPCWVTIGPSHVLYCRECFHLKGTPVFMGCCCGSEIANAVPRTLLWRSR